MILDDSSFLMSYNCTTAITVSAITEDIAAPILLRLYLILNL